MSVDVGVEIAIWHPSFTVEMINKTVGLKPRIHASIGELNERNGRVRTETHCRYSIGVFRQADILTGLAVLRRLWSPGGDSFYKEGGIAATYLTNVRDVAEVHLINDALEIIYRAGSSIVFRSI